MIEANNLDDEVWKDIAGYEGIYKISNSGKVKSLARKIPNSLNGFRLMPEKILKPIINCSGYCCVNLYSKTKSKKHRVHRLVAIAFIPNVENKLQVNHIDGNKLNNHDCNLEHCDSLHNIKHNFLIGIVEIGDNHHNSKLNTIKVLAIRRLFRIKPDTSQKKISEKLGVSKALIHLIVRNKTWKHI